jgi:hypothetical protein
VATPGSDCKDVDRQMMWRRPFPIRLFCGLIGRESRLKKARDLLQVEFGPIDIESPVEGFDYTDYYRDEMGSNLRRAWISFGEIRERAYLVEAKKTAVWIEERLARGGRRTVNIDPGYVDNAQVVLSTGKNFAHRIYIGAGYYAEVTLIYTGNAFRFLEWTYPDYRSSSALGFFAQARDAYHREMRRRDGR